MTIRPLQEAVGIALHALRESKVRTGLTILGVAVGVLVVVAIGAIIQGINRSARELIDAAGPNTFYVVRTSGFEVDILEDEESEFFRRPALRPELARSLEAAPTIENAYPIANLSWVGMPLRVEENRVDGTVFAVPPDYLVSDPGDIVAGRWFTAAEDGAARPVAVIDSSVVRDLFAPLNPLGRSLRIRGESFVVIGIYRSPPSLFSALVDHQVFVPFRSGRSRLMRSARFITFDDLVQLAVVAKPAVDFVEAVDQVIGRLRAERGLRPGQANDFDIMTQDDMRDQWNALTAVLFAVMFALSGVSLMVGGVGVVAVMVVSVTERTREIGIRKSLGATRRDILWQFLVEASTLTTVGGAIGLGLGGILAWAVSNLTPIPAVIPIWSIFLALAAAVLTGIVFGIYPAVRAARLDPVSALRYE